MRNGLLALLLLFAAVAVRAQETTPDAITSAVSSATTLFGVIVVLAVSVAGFFLGRKWLRRVG